MNLKKWSGSVTCCYGFVFDISQNGDAKRKEKKRKTASQIIRTFKNTFASVTKVFDVSRLSQIQLFQDQVKSPA